MKKILILILILMLTAASLCGCSASRLTFFDTAAPETSCFIYYVSEGDTVRVRFLYDANAEKELLKELSAIKVTPVSEIPETTADLRSLSISDKDGYSLYFTWSGESCVTSNKEFFSTTADISSICDKYEWTDEDTFSKSSMPNLAFIAKRNGAWNKAMLEKSGFTVESGIVFTDVRLENSVVACTLTNPTDEEICGGEYYSLEHKIDGEWYILPPEREMCFVDIAYIIAPGESLERSYDLSAYGELVPGSYRITAFGGYFEFEVK